MQAVLWAGVPLLPTNRGERSLLDRSWLAHYLHGKLIHLHGKPRHYTSKPLHLQYRSLHLFHKPLPHVIHLYKLSNCSESYRPVNQNLKATKLHKLLSSSTEAIKPLHNKLLSSSTEKTTKHLHVKPLSSSTGEATKPLHVKPFNTITGEATKPLHVKLLSSCT